MHYSCWNRALCAGWWQRKGWNKQKIWGLRLWLSVWPLKYALGSSSVMLQCDVHTLSNNHEYFKRSCGFFLTLTFLLAIPPSLPPPYCPLFSHETLFQFFSLFFCSSLHHLWIISPPSPLHTAFCPFTRLCFSLLSFCVIRPFLTDTGGWVATRMQRYRCDTQKTEDRTEGRVWTLRITVWEFN